MNRLVINTQTKETHIENYELSEEELLKRQQYNEFLEKQNKEHQIQELKQQLADWEYKNSKYLDGEYTEEEWAEIVAQRKIWREEIRQLEKELEEK